MSPGGNILKEERVFIMLYNIGSLCMKLDVSYVLILTFNIFDILHFHLLYIL